MQFVEHSLIKLNSIESRIYQENILRTAKRKNTLCVLGTGLGKTTIAVLLTANRIEKFPDSKILIMAPTRPLCAQHQKYFKDCLNIPEEDIILLTGKISPSKRIELYKEAKIISATPQTISNDIRNDILNLSDFSLLIVDETHRAVKRYPYPFVAKVYKKQSRYPLILGLTASPGGSREKIEKIRKNLFIEAVEIRTEDEKDVKPYVKELKTEWIKVDLPENLKNAQTHLKNALKKRFEKLKNYNIYIRTKKDLLSVQKRVSRQISTERKPILFYLISLIVGAVKIWHFLELLETQSVKAAKLYLDKVEQKKTKSDRSILQDIDFKKAIELIENEKHPKIKKLEKIIKEELENNEKVKIIVFSHFRNNIYNIHDILKPICSPLVLIGQSGERGLSQKEQIGIIRDFNDGAYNCLITSPIGEEGLHIPSADLAIFYDSVPSEIRTIQRRGRVGRTKVGKIIFLLTRKTRDESYYWTAYRKEKKMRTILREMQKKEKTIEDFIG
jgi:Fanconi anemia group M protein